jgi:hypothetical protein
MKKQNGLVTIEAKELSQVDNNLLNPKQLGFLMSATPAQYIRKRKAKGPGEWDYVSGAYIKKVLNLMFGWDWDFRILDYKFDLNIKQAFVHGELTCRANNRTIVKQQFGRVDIKFRVEWIEGKKAVTDQPMDLGNDLKAAATDALKKCAAELGIAADIYSPDDFRERNVVEDLDYVAEIKSLLNEVDLKEEDRMNIERIIDQKETQSYIKAYQTLKNLKK